MDKKAAGIQYVTIEDYPEDLLKVGFLPPGT